MNRGVVVVPLLIASVFVVAVLMYLSQDAYDSRHLASMQWLRFPSDRRVYDGDTEENKRRTCQSLCAVDNAAGSYIDLLDEMQAAGLKPRLLSRVSPRPVDNDTSHVVQNVVHYVLFGAATRVRFDFQHYLSFRSVSRFLKPQYVFLHGDMIPRGEWWTRTVADVDNLYHVYRKKQTTIYGQKIKYIQHLADFIRLTIIIDYGGIYLDTDMLILKSLDPLRVHRLTLGVSGPNEISNAIIIAQRGAPFLRMWLENYHNFVPHIWGYNSVTFGHRLYELFPHLVHVEKEDLLRPTWKETDLLYSIHNKFYNWSHSYSFHVSGENVFKVPKTPEQLKGYNNTLGEVMRYIYFGTSKLLPISGVRFKAQQ